MDHADQTDPIVPDPPFSITLERAQYTNVIIVPGWNQETDGAEFEVYSNGSLIAKIRRNPYDVEGWHAYEGDLSADEESEIGEKIDNHYN